MRIFKGFIFLAFIFAGWVLFHTVEEPAVDDLKITSHLIKVNASDNGYEILSYLDDDQFKLISSDDKSEVIDILNGKKDWNQEFVDKVLADNTKLFEDINASNQRTYFKFPQNESIADIASYSSFFNAWHLLELKSRDDFRKSNFSDSIETLRVGLRYAQRIKSDESGYLISYFIGSSMHSKAVLWAHKMSSIEGGLNREQLIQLKSIFSEIKPYGEDGFEKVFYGEYLFVKALAYENINNTLRERYSAYQESIEAWNDYNDEDDESWPKPNIYELLTTLFPSYYLSPKEVLSASMPYYIKLQSNSSKFCGEIELPILTEGYDLDFGSDYSLIDLIEPDSMTSKWIESMDANIWGEYFDRVCLFHTYKSSVLTTIAIKLYQFDSGELPLSLPELNPRYLKEEQLDYFSGKPLLFSRENNWIYSLGVNIKDNGGSLRGNVRGRCEKGEECYNNPTISINFFDYKPENRKKECVDKEDSE